MNERIKELAASVVPVHRIDIGMPVYQYWLDFEKFAELIIKECIIAADSNPYVSAETLIKEHSGVK